MKICGSCKNSKPLDQFNKNASKPDGLGSKCKGCVKEYNKSYYESDRASQYARVKINQRDRVEDHRELYWNYLASHPCADCGEDDPLVLEADHVRGEKRKDVTRLLQCGYSWPTILEELGKCDIVCANCHRRRTYGRARSWRSDWVASINSDALGF